MGNGLVVRALTYFIEKLDDWSREEISRDISRAVEVLDKASRFLEDRGYVVWSKRISFPIPPTSMYKRLSDIVSDIVSKEYSISLGGFYIENTAPIDLLACVERGFYISILWRSIDRFPYYTRLLMKVSDERPLYSMKIALSLNGEPLQTPYYPLSISVHGGYVGVALLYPDQMLVHYLKQGINGVKECLESVDRIVEEFKSIGLNVFIDYSISPWMDVSVVRLVEAVSGSKIGFLDFINGIYILNKVLEEHVRSRSYARGFNQVMLPYIEDELLVKAGDEGVIDAKDFLLYSSVCVAGPDTIVVPVDYRMLLSYIRASYTIASSKNKPMGLRIIPVPNSPGDIVDLGIFGKVAVLDYNKTHPKISNFN